MLIGIDASRANKDHKTGTEWYSYYVIRWLAKLDRENQYILYTDQPLKAGLLDLSTPQYIPGQAKEEIVFDDKGYQKIKSPFNNFKAKVLKWPSRSFWTQARLSLEMLLHAPDILFVPAHTLPIVHPRKSIVTIHDIGFEREARLYKQEQMGFESRQANIVLNLLVRLFTLGKYKANTLDYLRWSTKYALKKAKKIITVSNYTKEDLLSLYMADRAKIKVVHNGYNRFLYKKSANVLKVQEIMDKYDISGPYLLYVGRIEKKKNTSTMIEAFAIMKEANRDIGHKLVLAGDASYGYDETNYMIREYRLDNDVIMPGWVAEEDLPYLYSGATAYIFPSMYEGFGITLLQAMACGVPIVTSACTSIPEVVGDAAIFFNPQNAQSMADAITKVIKDDDLRSELITKGYQRIKNFSWEKTARKIMHELNNF